MAKIFTITEGLENMGALRTGGQGSVYKGKRIGEIIVAVKLLPTPILNESEEDKNYRDFRNEVEKLKKVNEEPNPNVVKILNSGITESGSFPFIEMEFIEGPDVEELLKAPHDSVFTVSEVIKLACQLAHALSHCHKISVKHGDIKSNNVKFNIHTGNYILLDFGMAIMSDEQRRTSLRHAGAVEFMAPEQNEGMMLFQSDVYGFGIILYEILAGVVPFPLKDNGQTARNTVMVSHMEMPVPDVLELREQNLPESWLEEKKRREMQVPKWISDLIYKCLEKNPDERFSNGVELYEAILHNSTQSISQINEGTPVLQTENERLQTLITQEQERAKKLEQQLNSFRNNLAQKEQEVLALQGDNGGNYQGNEDNVVSISKPVFFSLVLLLTCLAAFAGYSLLTTKKSDKVVAAGIRSDSTSLSNASDTTTSETPKYLSQKEQRQQKEDSLLSALKDTINSEKVADPEPAPETTTDETPTDGDSNGNNDIGKIFTLLVKESYFHDKPDPATRRNAFINTWNDARLTAINDLNGFIYVSYKNDEGVVTKGWLNKKDLIIIGE